MGKDKRISSERFEAECLALLDRVQQTGEPLVVTKRGKPVARVEPIDRNKARSLAGSVKVSGDLLAPIDASWEAAPKSTPRASKRRARRKALAAIGTIEFAEDLAQRFVAIIENEEPNEALSQAAKRYLARRG